MTHTLNLVILKVFTFSSSEPSITKLIYYRITVCFSFLAVATLNSVFSYCDLACVLYSCRSFSLCNFLNYYFPSLLRILYFSHNYLDLQPDFFVLGILISQIHPRFPFLALFFLFLDFFIYTTTSLSG